MYLRLCSFHAPKIPTPFFAFLAVEIREYKKIHTDNQGVISMNLNKTRKDEEEKNKPTEMTSKKNENERE